MNSVIVANILKLSYYIQNKIRKSFLENAIAINILRHD